MIPYLAIGVLVLLLAMLFYFFVIAPKLLKKRFEKAKCIETGLKKREVINRLKSPDLIFRDDENGTETWIYTLNGTDEKTRSGAFGKCVKITLTGGKVEKTEEAVL